ncbi:MAG: hypothetical protein K9M07_07370 [Simkaniaceae bacterium]|nr:hypothetical protein [Simkaniaceae bacterium]MCF7853041.1 hypothetical protein [Simkaniaceae bacterium]
MSDLPQRPALWKRICAKLLDYTLVISGFLCISNLLSFDYTLPQLLAIFFGVSFLWLPLEILLLKLFKTTPGKYLFGISIPHRLKFIELIKSCSLSALKSFLFFIPLFNIVVAFVLIREESNAPSQLISKKRKLHKLIILWTIVVGVFGYTGLNFDIESGSQTEIAANGKIQKKLNWVTYKHPEQSWKAAFPNNPEERDFTLNLPKGEQKQLGLKELVFTDHDGAVEYTISSIEIPHNLMSWGHKLILRGSLKIITDNVPGAKVISKKNFRYRNNPSLHYTLEDRDSERMGRLILIGNTIYKIEISYPKEMKYDLEQELFKFINSFEW